MLDRYGSPLQWSFSKGYDYLRERYEHHSQEKSHMEKIVSNSPEYLAGLAFTSWLLVLLLPDASRGSTTIPDTSEPGIIIILKFYLVHKILFNIYVSWQYKNSK